MNSIERAFLITGKFEGQHGYSAVAGNFDGQLMSFGVFQFNAGQGTLRPLLQKSLDYLGHEKAKQIFGNDNLYVLKQKLLSETAFKAFCLSINDARKQIINPWFKDFQELGATPECQKAQREAAVRYVNTAKRAMGTYGFTSDRAFCLLFDVAIQNGSVLKSADTEYRAKIKPGMTEQDKLKILATAVANSANPKWQADVLSRKGAIAAGAGRVHGRNYNLEAEFGLHNGLVVYE